MYTEEDFKVNLDLQKDLTRIVTNAIRDINTEPGLTPAQRADLIKQLGGVPKNIMYEYLNSTYRSGMDISREIKELISEGRPRGGRKPSDRTPEQIKAHVKRINTPKRRTTK